MSPEEWKGNNIVEPKRTLILGESHYDENAEYGTPVTFPTADVVKAYLSHREQNGGKAKWDRFFDRMAESFGYSKERSKEFYQKVWFGNYVPVVCGKGGANRAKDYMALNRTEYNDSLFSFVNENKIAIIVCFSKDTFWNLPQSVDEDKDSYKEWRLSTIGGRGNIINYYEYAPNISHGCCNVKLNSSLEVYGIRHPSCQGGYDAKSVYEFLSKQEIFKDICI